MKNTKDKFTNEGSAKRMCHFGIIEALFEFYDRQYRLGGLLDEGHKKF